MIDSQDPAADDHAGQDNRGRHRRRTSAYSLLAARLIAVLVAVTVLGASAVGWSLNSRGTSDAIAAAGNVGVASLLAALPSMATIVTNPAPTAASVPQPVAAPVTITTAAPSAPVPAQNILLVGSDSRTDAQGAPLSAEELAQLRTQDDGGGVNTDSLMVLHIPAGGGQATAISIPRDTWMGASVVDAPGVTGPDSMGRMVTYQPSKINSFYGSAKFYDAQYLSSQGVSGAQLERESDESGRTMLIKVIQQFTGVKIDHYAEVNLLGFYLLSNAIGGVQVCLNHAVDDPDSGARFPAGLQTVQGSTALAFVRQRHGLPGGDLDRIKRQQAFLASAANQILSVGTLTSPSKLAALVTAANRSVVLDSGFDLFTFAQQMVGLTSGGIHFATIPTEPETTSTGSDALAANSTKIRAEFAELVVTGSWPTSTTSAATTSTTETGDQGEPTTGTSDSGSDGSADGSTAAGSIASAASTTTAVSTPDATSGGVPCVN